MMVVTNFYDLSWWLLKSQVVVVCGGMKPNTDTAIAISLRALSLQSHVNSCIGVWLPTRTHRNFSHLPVVWTELILFLKILTIQTYQNLGWTIEMNLSMATDTVAQIEPLREICRIGDNQGNKNGWTAVWKFKRFSFGKVEVLNV